MNGRKDNDPMSGKGRPAGEPGGQIGHQDFAAPLGSATSGRIIFVSGASNVSIHADLAMQDLYRAHFEGRVPTVDVQGGTVTVRYPSSPPLDWTYRGIERPAEVALNVSIPWQIEVCDGASKLIADLSKLKLGSLDLSGGASRVELTLPEPSGTVSVRVLGGASNVTIRRSEGVAARLRVGGGSTNLAFDEERFGAVGGEVDLRSPDYEDAADRYDIAVTGGANAVTVGAR